MPMIYREKVIFLKRYCLEIADTNSKVRRIFKVKCIFKSFILYDI